MVGLDNSEKEVRAAEPVRDLPCAAPRARAASRAERARRAPIPPARAIGVALALGTTLSNAVSFRAGGLAAFAGQLPLLLRPFRAWQARGDDVASFWGVGVAATIAGLLASVVIGLSVPGIRDTL